MEATISRKVAEVAWVCARVAFLKETADSDVDLLEKILVHLRRKRKPTLLSSHTNNMVLPLKEKEKLALAASRKEYQRKENDLEGDSKTNLQKHTIHGILPKSH
jgi:hypothetical protein